MEHNPPIFTVSSFKSSLGHTAYSTVLQGADRARFLGNSGSGGAGTPTINDWRSGCHLLWSGVDSLFFVDEGVAEEDMSHADQTSN